MKQYFAKTYKGLEQILAAELQSLGAQQIVPDFRGVRFIGDKEIMYKVNYQSRLALRILEKVAECHVKDDNALYEQVYAIDWPSIFDKKQHFCVDAVGITDQFKNTQYTALKTKDRNARLPGACSSVQTTGQYLFGYIGHQSSLEGI